MSDEMSVLQYLLKELSVKLGEWQRISDVDKTQLREWAETEMNALGIPIKNAR